MLSRRFLTSSALTARLGLRHKYVASQYEAPVDGSDNANGSSNATSSSGPTVTPAESSPNTNSTNVSSNTNSSKPQPAAPAPPAKPKTPEEIKEEFIEELVKRDKELFELKRQHELSMLRVQQHQNRILQDQHDRGIYYEQTVNVHTFETITVGQYTQRNTMHHVIGLQKLRNFKIQVAIATTVYVWAFIVYRYIINPDMEYIEVGIKKIGDSSTLRIAYQEKKKKEEYEKLEDD